MGTGNVCLKNEGGFSLIELIAVTGILSVLAFLAVPMVSNTFSSVNNRTAREQLEFDLQRARAEALAKGARVIFATGNGGATYEAGVEYLPFSPNPASDETLYIRTLPENVTITLSGSVLFNPRGYLVDTNNDLATQTFSLSRNGEVFCTGSIFATGLVGFDEC